MSRLGIFCTGVAVMGGLFGGHAVAGGVTYVNGALATGANNGTSWADAYRGIGGLQTALVGSSAGDEVWVAAGRYVPSTSGNRFSSFLLKSNVELYGGFDGGEVSRAQRDIAANETILSGDLSGNDPNVAENSYNVVDGNFAQVTAVLDGFSITGGNANHGSSMLDQVGAGMIVRDGSHPTIRNCRFHNNRVVFGGGAMYFRASSPTIENCVFEDNNGGAFGGAWDMFSSSSPTVTNCRFANNIARRAGGVETFGNCSPVMTNCVFEGNRATANSGFGGGMYMANGGLPRLNNCRFIDNIARFGGGVYNQAVSPRFNNCEFVGNSLTLASGQGGGMYNTQSNPQLRNCLIADNSAGNGGAMLNTGGSSPALWNCTIVDNSVTSSVGGILSISTSPQIWSSIIWANSGSQITNSGAGNTTVRYSTVQGGWAGPGQDNIASDPQFADMVGGDYRLTSASLGIDAGDPNLNPPAGSEFDLDGHARILCSRVDMGAYESGLGDADCDSDVDVNDFDTLLDCVSGADVNAASGCEPFDSDGDGDVDWADVAAFQLAFTD